MTKTDYLTKPYGERPTEPVEVDAFDFLLEHGGEGGAQAVRDLAALLRKPRCPECAASTCCYVCAAQGGPGADLLPRDDGAQGPVPGETL